MTQPLVASQIRRSVRQGVMELLINRPEKKNALTQQMYRLLVEHLQSADRDDRVRVVLIRGADGSFCSGNDVTDFQVDRDPHQMSPGILFLETLHRLDKPLVAAVEGAAVGIGTTMLLHCDLVYASTRATFRVPFANLGLCPEGGASYLLPRLVGDRRASEMLLLGEPYSAREALAFGLINRIYDEADLMDAVHRHVRRLVAQPRESVMLTKRLLKRSRLSSISETIRFEGRHFAERLTSTAFQKAVSAFLSRRESKAESPNNQKE